MGLYTLIPVPPTIYNALIVRSIGSTGIIHFDDGSTLQGGNGGAVTTATGNVVPNIGDYVLTPLDPVGTPEAGYGRPDPSNTGYRVVQTPAQLAANYVPN